MESRMKDFLYSWERRDKVVHTNQELLEWINTKNKAIKVDIRQCKLSDTDFWVMDQAQGQIKTINDSFFSIAGLRVAEGSRVLVEQPVVLQHEIGYLGIIGSMIEGVLCFLIQAKIEPGNINKIQLSPTIQATKSNFMQKHGGNKPAYLDYFLQAQEHEIVVDQIQSEQSSRFYKKRNRNIMLIVDEKIECSDNFRWMSLGQIKEMMKYDNLVNMDTRTVLSCIPWNNMSKDIKLDDLDCTLPQEFLKSMYSDEYTKSMWNEYNNVKMFHNYNSEIVKLTSLNSWRITDEGMVCDKTYPFDVIYADIEIEGREVKEWIQPLFRAKGVALFVLVTTVINGERRYLVKLQEEVGCFDTVELGPSLQLEPNSDNYQSGKIERTIMEALEERENVILDVLLSEEGGRFYHEQNRNVILDVYIEVEGEKDYFWLSFGELNRMVQFNNILNIQLRNLLSLVEV